MRIAMTRLVGVGAVTVAAAAGLALWAIDPFGGHPRASASGSVSTAPTASVTKQNMSAQLTLDATLGYTGTYSISYQRSTGSSSGNSGSLGGSTTTTTDPPTSGLSGSPGSSGSSCPSHPSSPISTTSTTTTTVPSTTTPTTTPTTTTTAPTTTTTAPTTTTTTAPTTTTTTAPTTTTSTPTTTTTTAPTTTLTTLTPTTTTTTNVRSGHPAGTTPTSTPGGSLCPGQPTGNGQPSASGSFSGSGHPLGSGSPSGSGKPSGSGSPSGSGQPPALFTSVPTIGQVIHQGQALYAVNGTPAILLYGSTPAWRTLSQGVTGPDVAQLNADLVALRDATTAQIDPSSDYYSAATAVKHLQANLGVTQTGSLNLGQVTFLPTTVRVTSVSATVGGTVAGGTVLTGTSTTRQVTATLAASRRSQVRVGDKVIINLPDGQSTGGTVASVGTIATSPPSGTSGSATLSPPTVQLEISLADPEATGSVDQAPVTIAVTTATVQDVLAVPVAALITTPDGHPAVETQTNSGITKTVAVTLGLFDDNNGLIQVSGPGLTAGKKIARPDQPNTT
jgi:hypothetical protein